MRRFDEAEAALQRALSIWRSRSASPLFEGYGLMDLGRLKLAAGATREARELLERAIAILEKRDAELTAEAEFALAQAVWASPGERRRAVDLARRARAQLAGKPTHAIENARLSRRGCASADRPRPADSAAVTAALARARQVVLREAADQRAPRDAEQLRGAGLIADALLERSQDPFALAVVVGPDAAPRLGAPARAPRGLGAGPTYVSTGRSSTVIGPPSDSATARSITLRSWRMLPGHW